MKRSQGAQFNWIFILVAGVIILGFFTVFIFKYVELENKKSNFYMVNIFNTNLDLLERTSIFTPNLALGRVTKMDFMCSGDDFLLVVNDENDLAYNLGDKMVFAPKNLRDKSLGVWIYEWNYPFLVSKFLFLTSPKYKYILVGIPPDIVNEIPEEVFNIEYTSTINSIKDPYNTKVVFFSEDNEGDELVSRFEGIEVVYIDTINKKIKFYTTGEEFDYFGDAFLLGAIFSGSSDNYKCALNSGLKRLKLISRIYSGKVYLYGLSGNMECSGLLNNLDSGLSIYKSYNLGEGSLDKNMETLKETNLELHGRGCSALF